MLLVALAAPLLAQADNCQLRMKEEGRVIVPRHGTGPKLDEAGGACTVFLQYSLDEKGVPGDIETYAEVPACAHFENSARKALQRTTFSRGVPETGCRHEYTIKLEP